MSRKNCLLHITTTLTAYLTLSATRKDQYSRAFGHLWKDFVGIQLKDHNSHLVSSSKGNANILSSKYQVFMKEDLESAPAMPQSPYVTLPGTTVKGVHKLLLRLKPGKAHGPDAIPNKILMETADQITPCLTRIF